MQWKKWKRRESTSKELSKGEGKIKEGVMKQGKKQKVIKRR